jgi:hypothetical protein
VEANVHLYEVLPGSSVADIAANESETPGLGASDDVTLAQLHPLTEEAASVLLGRPGLGRKLGTASDRKDVAVGQRLYHLAIPGKRPLAASAGRHGRRAVRRLAHLNVVLDAAQDQIRVSLFLSEVKAQKLAVRLRQQSHPGSLAAGLHKFLARRLPAIVRGRYRRRLRVVAAGAGGALPLQNLSETAAQALSGKLQQWLTQGFVEFAKNQASQFLAAAEDPADGLTLTFTIEHPPGLKELCQALVEKSATGAKVAELLAGGGQPAVRVGAAPGHRCG